MAVSQTLSLSKGDVVGYILFERPITVAILVLTPIIAWSLWRRSRRLQRRKLGTTTQEE